jgi:hypothetical protein
VLYKLLGQPKGRIGDDRFDARGHPDLTEKITNEMQSTVIENVGGDDCMTEAASYTNDGTGTGSGLPDTGRDLLVPEQRLGANFGRLITVMPTLGERMTLDLTGMI